MNKDRILDRELREDIEKKVEIKKHFYMETPKTLLLWDIFKYYLTTTESRRNNYCKKHIKKQTKNVRTFYSKTQT